MYDSITYFKLSEAWAQERPPVGKGRHSVLNEMEKKGFVLVSTAAYIDAEDGEPRLIDTFRHA